MSNIDPAFLSGSLALGDLTLSHVRLQNDARWPWRILIPQRAGATELEDLSRADRNLLMDETVRAGEAVRAMGRALGFEVEKLNAGALGNITRQLHIHVVGRRTGDGAWPGPVWGVGLATPLSPGQIDLATTAVRHHLDFRA